MRDSDVPQEHYEDQDNKSIFYNVARAENEFVIKDPQEKPEVQTMTSLQGEIERGKESERIRKAVEVQEAMKRESELAAAEEAKVKEHIANQRECAICYGDYHVSDGIECDAIKKSISCDVAA